jgi:hypothetical protein
VKLLRVENGRYVFKLVPREKDLLTIVLRLYPVIPPAHQQLSKASTAEKAHQHLLDEALAEQRTENKRLVEDLLTDSQRFRNAGAFTEMILTAAEIEWVLQVLNDVHVGNWILLGSPEARPRFSPESENARFVVVMDLACMFQSELLEAINPSS